MTKASLKNSEQYVGLNLCNLNKIVGVKLFDFKGKTDIYKLRYNLTNKLYILSITNIETGENEVFVDASYLKILSQLVKFNKHEGLREVLEKNI